MEDNDYRDHWCGQDRSLAAWHLVRGGEHVALAARNEADAAALAGELGTPARAATVN